MMHPIPFTGYPFQGRIKLTISKPGSFSPIFILFRLLETFMDIKIIFNYMYLGEYR